MVISWSSRYTVELLIYNLSHFDSVLLWQQLFGIQIYGLIISMPVQTAQGVQIWICAELDKELFFSKFGVSDRGVSPSNM